MRENKFRAWNPVLKRMSYNFEEINVTGDDIVAEIDCGKIVVKYMKESGLWVEAPTMQYTGVHDDSDEQEELFDGDIVQVELEGQKHICKVQYCGCGYMFVADSLPDGYLWFSDIVEFDRNYCWAEGTKKLGNIYENPSLLEVTHE